MPETPDRIAEALLADLTLFHHGVLTRDTPLRYGRIHHEAVIADLRWLVDNIYDVRLAALDRWAADSPDATIGDLVDHAAALIARVHDRRSWLWRSIPTGVALKLFLVIAVAVAVGGLLR